MDIEEGKEESKSWCEDEGNEEEKVNETNDEEDKIKAESTLFKDGLAKLTIGLRRRRFRQTPARDIEEGKSDAYSPRDKPTPSPRHTSEAKTDASESAVVTASRRVSSPLRLSSAEKPPEDEQTKEARPCLSPTSDRIVASSMMISDPEKKIRERYSTKLRSTAEKVPEIHFIGEVKEGEGFNHTFISVKFSFEWGKSWSHLGGDDSSQTQYASSDDGVHVFNHPVDLHFASFSMKGWPRIVIQAWECDEYGRSILAGYGFAHLPTEAGCHDLDIHCFRPCGTFAEELESFFLGRTSKLEDDDLVFARAWEARSNLVTSSSGIVRLSLTVILRFFDHYNVG